MSPLAVLTSSCVPPGVRGALTQWMIEVLPGIFVGRPTARIRERLWVILSDALVEEPNAYAALITQADTEQGFVMKRIGDHRYSITDFDGLQLITVRHRRGTPAIEEPLGIESF